ncbi:MAG: hypothetical protein KGL39_03160 [Patescibacteria group bacterium]|nr:hypothetical protein [Patescibacteria group bacterium]
MGTRSDIIVHRADGKWARIYCHWDGYIAHNGKILFDHYNSQERADALVALGNISSLAPEIGEKHDFDYALHALERERVEKLEPGSAYSDPEYLRLKNMCNVYGRDRSEKDCEAKVGDTIHAVWPPDETWTEFTYVFFDGGSGTPSWWVGDPDTGSQALVPLKDALDGKAEIHSLIKTPFGITLGRH